MTGGANENRSLDIIPAAGTAPLEGHIDLLNLKPLREGRAATNWTIRAGRKVIQAAAHATAGMVVRV